MRQAIIISITADKQIELPPDIKEKLVPGDEYLIWQNDDSIFFKKVQKPRSYSELSQKIDALGTDSDELSMEEICQIVKEVRQKMNQESDKNASAS